MDDNKINELRNIQSRSLYGFIYKEIEEMILAGKIQPGARINESRLARDLNISRAPIREACRKLERFGYVRFHPNRGTYVEKVTLKDVSELCDLRGALDALAGEKAAERFQNRDLEDLNAHLGRMAGLVRQEDIEGYFKENLAFHLNIISISGNRHLHKVYEGFYKKTLLCRKLFYISPSRLAASFAQHKQIVETLAAKDAPKASKLLRDHVLDEKDHFLALLNPEPY